MRVARGFAVRGRDGEKGQAILVVAMLLLVLIVLIALAVDGGNAYAQQRLAQNAVDAGVLAGIQALAQEFERDTPSLREHELFDIITDYTSQNGIPAASVDVWYTDIDGDRLHRVNERGHRLVPRRIMGPGGNETEVNGLEVWGDRPFDTFFIRVVGRETMTAGAESTAWVWCGLCSGELLFPAAIDTHTFTDTIDGYPRLNQTYVIWDREMEFPGNFGWLNWGDRGEYPQNPSESVLAQNINDTRRSGMWSIGDWVPATTGVTGGNPVRQAIARKIYPPDGDPEQLPNHKRETLFIPIYDYSCDNLPEDDPDYEEWHCSPGSNVKYRILYFIGFEMTCMHFGPGKREIGECTREQQSPHEKWLEGHFLKVVIQPGEGVCPDGSRDACTYKMRRPSVGR
jgi:hypothetical protein